MRAISFGVLLAMSVAGCGGDDKGGDPANYPTLEAFVKAHQEARAAGDHVRLDAMNLSLMPTKDELAAVIKDDDAGKAFLETYRYTRASALKEGVLKMIRGNILAAPPGRNTLVTGSSAGDIVKYAKGSNAFKEFPGGMRKFAPLIRDPAQMFYVVEFLEPGKSAGIKFTCFTKVNGNWAFLMKPWRRIK